jgi:hypothetical protein
MVNSGLTERDLAQNAETSFSDFLRSLGGSVRSIEREPRRSPLDLIVEAEIRGKPITFVAECKTQGEPRYLRQAADQLRDVLPEYPTAYPIIIAPYISDSSAALLASKRVGYYDLAGNALIDFGPIFVRVYGKPRPNPVQRKLKSIFRPRSARILRVLLTDPNKSRYVQDLSREANVSIGLVSKLKQKLIELELATETRGLKLSKPGDLLDEWARSYQYDENRIEKYYSTFAPAELERKLPQVIPTGVPYALTMFSGASKVAPFVRYNFASFYFSGRNEDITEPLKLKSVTTGANVWIFRPQDDGVYYGLQQIEGLRVASNLQLYLDLINFKGRGEEQAGAIREQLLRF